jgi:hypothetical protein
MRNTITQCLIILLIVGGMGLGVFSRKNSPKVTEVQRPLRSALSRAPSSVVPATTAVYRFIRSLNTTLSDQPWMNLRYEGELYISRKKVDSQSSWLELRFKMDGQTQLSSTLFAKVGEDGKIVEINVSGNATPEVEQEISILKDLLSIYAFRGDEDSLGRYQAMFSEFLGGTLKEKKKYVSLRSSNVSDVEIVFSKHRWVASADSFFPGSITGEEKTRSGPEQGLGLWTHSQYQMVRLKAVPALAVNDTSTSTEKTTFALTEVKISKPVMTWNRIESDLQKWNQLHAQEKLKLFRKLNVALQSDPNLLGPFVYWMKSRAQRNDVQVFGIGVLATLGSDGAQSALLELYATSPPLRQTVLGALTTTEAPLSTSTQNFLQERAHEFETHPDIAMGAAFAIGSSLKKTPDSIAEQSLLDLFDAARSPELKRGYLDAMGNSGNPRFLPAIEEALKSDDVAMREKAVFALRWMEDAKARAILEQATQDSNTRVQTQATLARRFLAP